MTPSFDIILCDMQPALVRAWEQAFAPFPEVVIEQGDLLEVEADAYVSPANSYGIMDGGIDLALSTRFPRIEKRVQEAIAGVDILLPVGQALVVETEDGYVSYLVCAPTMEVPSHVGHTNNAFRAMLALLKAVEKFNAANEEPITSVGIPGLCTGVGGMEPAVAAQQMALAYAEWSGQ